MRPALTAALCAGAVAIGFAGCGGDSDDGGTDLARFAPAGTPVFVQGAIRPEGGLKESVDAILARFPDGDSVGQRLIQSIDESAKEDGQDFTYEDDIEPWLGERAAFFATSFRSDPKPAPGEGGTDLGDGAIVAEVTDEDTARERIKALADGPVTDTDYNGVTISTSPSKDTPGQVNAVAVFDGVAVAGTEQGVKDAVNASTGQSLSSDSGYSGLAGDAGDDVMASAFVDPMPLIDAIPPSPGFGADERSALEKAYGDALEDPVVASLQVTDDQVTIDFSASSSDLTPTGGTALLGDGFSDAWAALGIPELGKSFAGLSDPSRFGLSGSQIDEVDSAFQEQSGFSLSDLGKLDDAAFFAAGTSIDQLQIGGIIQISDAAVRNKLLAAMRKGLAGSGATVRPADLEGADQAFSVGVPDLPIPINVGVKGDEVVIGGGAATEALLSSDGGLTDSEGYQAATDALGEGTDLAFMLQLPPIVELVDSTGQSDADFEQARPYLDAFDFFAIGIQGDGDRSTSRTVVRFSD